MNEPIFGTRISDTFFLPLPQSSRLSGYLVRIYPAHRLEQPIELGGTEITIGRDENCELRLDQDSISRRHASIQLAEGEATVKDLHSTNGTYVNDKKIGDLTVLRSGDRIRFGNQIFKYLASDAIESEYHEIVFKQLTTDGLTHIYNKRFLIDSIEREMRQSIRGGQSMSVMMMDLDKFKSINDRYGHLAGDAVLVEFARRASTVLQSGEILARYGGEEFSILCSPATVEQAVQVAERVRAITEASPVHFESSEIPISVSIGVAIYSGQSESTPERLLQEADQQLYRAKNNGRNQVQFHSSN
ncbi:MAG: GGDEF domain-containing protein [Planctomycetales bacterium]|nr:GGDEF domain-containing protein [Planctomycetales bacterium]